MSSRKSYNISDSIDPRPVINPHRGLVPIIEHKVNVVWVLYFLYFVPELYNFVRKFTDIWWTSSVAQPIQKHMKCISDFLDFFEVKKSLSNPIIESGSPLYEFMTHLASGNGKKDFKNPLFPLFDIFISASICGNTIVTESQRINIAEEEINAYTFWINKIKSQYSIILILFGIVFLAPNNKKNKVPLYENFFTIKADRFASSYNLGEVIKSEYASFIFLRLPKYLLVLIRDRETLRGLETDKLDYNFLFGDLDLGKLVLEKYRGIDKYVYNVVAIGHSGEVFYSRENMVHSYKNGGVKEKQPDKFFLGLDELMFVLYARSTVGSHKHSPHQDVALLSRQATHTISQQIPTPDMSKYVDPKTVQFPVKLYFNQMFIPLMIEIVLCSLYVMPEIYNFINNVHSQHPMVGLRNLIEFFEGRCYDKRHIAKLPDPANRILRELEVMYEQKPNAYTCYDALNFVLENVDKASRFAFKFTHENAPQFDDDIERNAHDFWMRKINNEGSIILILFGMVILSTDHGKINPTYETRLVIDSPNDSTPIENIIRVEYGARNANGAFLRLPKYLLVVVKDNKLNSIDVRKIFDSPINMRELMYHKYRNGNDIEFQYSAVAAGANSRLYFQRNGYLFKYRTEIPDNVYRIESESVRNLKYIIYAHKVLPLRYRERAVYDDTLQMTP